MRWPCWGFMRIFAYSGAFLGMLLPIFPATGFGNILTDRKGLKGIARRSAKRGASAEVTLTFEESVGLMISYTRIKIKGVSTCPESRIAENF
jgi:hypothetical protein